MRSAIVNVTNYYLRMAQTKTPAEMEAVIWHHDSIDGVDHGQSCAAFASLMLELAAQVVGQQSWVTGGASYPWPLHDWADARVNPNPASLGIMSIQQDAEAHDRWHPLGDGYQPQPGDWVVFDGHVEVVTGQAAGVLHTIGGDSLPNFSVNAHGFSGPLAAQGVVGFVNNGARPAGHRDPRALGAAFRRQAAPGHGGGKEPGAGRARHPGAGTAAAAGHRDPPRARRDMAATPAQGTAAVPGAYLHPAPLQAQGGSRAAGTAASRESRPARPTAATPSGGQAPAGATIRPAADRAPIAARTASAGDAAGRALPGAGPGAAAIPACGAPGAARARHPAVPGITTRVR